MGPMSEQHPALSPMPPTFVAWDFVSLGCYAFNSYWLVQMTMLQLPLLCASISQKGHQAVKRLMGHAFNWKPVSEKHLR